MKKHLILLLLIVFAASFLAAQTYVEIPIDTSIHFNVTMEPGQTYYYSTIAASQGQAASTLLGFFDINDNLLDFIDVDIDNVFVCGIIPPSYIIYCIDFNISLNADAPPPSTIDDVSMITIFLNSAGSVTGGYIRSNMSLTIEGTSSVEGVSSQSLKIICYPNPTEDVVRIEHSDNQSLGLVEVFDSKGIKVISAYSDSPSQELNLQDLPSGVYWIRLQIENRLFNYKVLKTN